MPFGWVAGATLASGVIGAGASLYGASQAADAAKDASDVQQNMYRQTRNDLQPFVAPGRTALEGAYNLAALGPTAGGPDYVAMAQQNLPGRMTQAELEQTPGYQFTLGQGLKAAQSAAAARGLGVSGASLKGAGTYATGLADNTYLNQFNVRQKGFEDILALNTGQQGNITNQYNRLAGLGTIGANAAAQVGTQGTSLANQSGKYLSQGGVLEGSGAINASNALTGSANNYLAYNAYQNRTNALQPMTGGYNNRDLIPAGGMNSTGNTWYS